MRKLIFTLIVTLTFLKPFAQDSTFYFTTSDSVRLFVRIAGKGQPCVFLHGGPGSTSYYFEAMPSATILEQKMKMIYFDQRGSGRSDASQNSNYSLSRMNQDIEEIRKALRINKWAVMGHSFAGILSTHYAYHHPQSVSALMLINGTLNLQYSMMSHIKLGLAELKLENDAQYNDTSKPLMERVGMVHKALTENDLWYKLMFRNGFEKKYSDSVTLSINNFNYDFGNKVWGEKEYFKDFTAFSKHIKCPVLIITGNKDFAIGPDHYKSFSFPKKTVVHYIGGHAPFQEEPQWFSEKVLQFISHI